MVKAGLKELNRFTDDPKARVLFCSFCARRGLFDIDCEEHPAGIPEDVLDAREYPPCFVKREE